YGNSEDVVINNNDFENSNESDNNFEDSNKDNNVSIINDSSGDSNEDKYDNLENILISSNNPEDSIEDNNCKDSNKNFEDTLI
ncbi:33050_t:CDS:1, partial [Racocetra persica]